MPEPAQHHRSSPSSLAGAPGEEAVELAQQAPPLYSAQQESAELPLVPPLLAKMLSSPLTVAVLGSTPQPRVPQVGSHGSDGGVVQPTYRNGGAVQPALAEGKSEAAVASMTNATSAHDQCNAPATADGQLSRRLAFERLAPAQYPTAAQEEDTRSSLETQRSPSSSSSATATDAAASGTGWQRLRRATGADPSTPSSVFHRRALEQLSRERTQSGLQDQQPSSAAGSSAYAASSTAASEPATPDSEFYRRARAQLCREQTHSWLQEDDVRCGTVSTASSRPSTGGSAPRRLSRRMSFGSGEAAKLRAAQARAEAEAAPPQPSLGAAAPRRLSRRLSFASGEAAKLRAARARAEAEAAGSLKLENGRKLFAAVKRGQLPMAREALSCAECDVNCHDHELNTPLHWAVKLEDAPALMLLLTHAAAHELDVNRANARGETALHLAAAAGQDRLVRELWRQPALKPELKDKDGHTAHRLAVRGKHKELAKLLVRLYCASAMHVPCMCHACAMHVQYMSALRPPLLCRRLADGVRLRVDGATWARVDGS